MAFFGRARPPQGDPAMGGAGNLQGPGTVIGTALGPRRGLGGLGGPKPLAGPAPAAAPSPLGAIAAQARMRNAAPGAGGAIGSAASSVGGIANLAQLGAQAGAIKGLGAPAMSKLAGQVGAPGLSPGAPGLAPGAAAPMQKKAFLGTRAMRGGRR